MIRRADLSDMPIGDCISIDGKLMQHVGGGQFQPAAVNDAIWKRFDSNDGETLHRLVA